MGENQVKEIGASEGAGKERAEVKEKKKDDGLRVKSFESSR